MKNIFKDIPEELKEELLEEIISGSGFNLERIISDGQSSPENFWYDQEMNEFVMVVSGSAELLYDDGRRFQLRSGDYLIIPAHQKHRVEWTNKNQKTIWLALHF